MKTRIIGTVLGIVWIMATVGVLRWALLPVPPASAISQSGGGPPQSKAPMDPVLQMLRMMTNPAVHIESVTTIGKLECAVEYGWDGRTWSPVGTNFETARPGDPRMNFMVVVRVRF